EVEEPAQGHVVEVAVGLAADVGHDGLPRGAQREADVVRRQQLVDVRSGETRDLGLREARAVEARVGPIGRELEVVPPTELVEELDTESVLADAALPELRAGI